MLPYRKTILIACSVLFFTVTALICAADSGNVGSVMRPIISNESTLIIDAGHGGEDGGAVSLTGEPESQINLAVAQRLDQIMGLYAIPVVMTRDTDISLHSDDARTLHEKKVSDLHNRTNMIQSVQNPVLISIHQNSYPSKKSSGAQVFFAPTEGSDGFAQIMQQILREGVDPQNGRQPMRIPDNIYLMNHISCCAILVECGFLTNPYEEQMLLDGAYQTKLAVALACGFLRFQNTPDEGEQYESENTVLLH